MEAPICLQLRNLAALGNVEIGTLAAYHGVLAVTVSRWYDVSSSHGSLLQHCGRPEVMQRRWGLVAAVLQVHYRVV